MKLLEALAWLATALFVFIAWDLAYGWQFAGGYVFFFLIIGPMVVLAVMKCLCFIDARQANREKNESEADASKNTLT